MYRLVARHPVLIHLDEGLDGLQKILLRDVGNAELLGRIVEAADIVQRAEEIDLPVSRAVGLHALENLLRIVQRHDGGLQGDGAVGDDAGVMPALAVGIIHEEHMVREKAAERDPVHGRFLLGGRGTGDLDIHYRCLLLYSCRNRCLHYTEKCSEFQACICIFCLRQRRSGAAQLSSSR